jgi:hypothetical protein
MINLDKIEVDIDFPKCNFNNKIFLKNIRLKDVIICCGCKRNIQLDDHMHTFRKAKKDIERQFKELQKMLNFKI